MAGAAGDPASRLTHWASTEPRRSPGLERAGTVLFAWLTPFAWLTTLLAELGLLRPGAALGSALLAGLIAWIVGNRSPRSSDRSVDRPARAASGRLVALVGVMVGVVLVGWPHEMVVGGRDPGVYVNTALLIARTGSLAIPDPLLAALESLRPPIETARLASPAVADHPGLIGFSADRHQPNMLQPHGLPLFPVLLAPLAWLGGPPLVLHGAGGFAVLACIALTALGTRLFGATAGLIAGLLLALNPAEVWHARQSAAEPLAQALLLGGLWLAVVAFDERDARRAVLAGVTLGLVHLTKIELIVLPPVIAGWLLWRWALGQAGRCDLAFGLGYGAVLAHAVVHATTLASDYVSRTMALAAEVLRTNLPLAATGPGRFITVALIAMGLLATGRWGLEQHRRQRDRSTVAHVADTVAGRVADGSALLIVLVLLYGLLPRPLAPTAAALANLSFGGTSIPGPTVQLAWYVTPLGLLLALAGLWRARVVWQREPVGPRAFVLVALLLGSALVLYQPMVVPDHFWAARRLLPMTIPAVLLLVGHALGTVWTWSFGPRLIRPARLALAVLIGAAGWTFWPFLTHREFAGVSDQIAAIASATEPASLVLIEQGDAAIRLALPLWAIHGRRVLAIDRTALIDGRLPRILEQLAAPDQPVYWIADISSQQLRSSIHGFPLTLLYAETPVDRLPRRVDIQRYVLTITRLR